MATPPTQSVDEVKQEMNFPEQYQYKRLSPDGKIVKLKRSLKPIGKDDPREDLFLITAGPKSASQTQKRSHAISPSNYMPAHADDVEPTG
eukprot:3849084-Pyramimonas_sp.AAC.1